MKKKKILFICDRLTIPARRDGLSIRYFPIIKSLSSRYDVSFLVVAKCPHEDKLTALAKICSEVIVVSPPTLSRKEKLLRKFQWFFCYLNPLSTPNGRHVYEGREIAEEIIGKLKDRSFDCTVYIWQRYADVFPQIAANINTRRAVIDYVDSPYLIHSRAKPRGFSLMHYIENFKIKHWERRIVNKLDGAVYITEEDAVSALRQQDREKVVIIKNGVYIDDSFVVSLDEEEIYDLGFVGNMSYKPNIKAALYLYEKIFLPLYSLDSTINLVIIGRDPAPSIVKLGDHPGVVVTGEVESIPEFIQKVKIAVFPMVSGGGLQNKVVDAMYYSKPVVTSFIGSEGVNATNGEHLLICNEPDEYIFTIRDLLKDKSKRKVLGMSGREFVISNFSWDEIINQYYTQVVEGISDNR